MEKLSTNPGKTTPITDGLVGLDACLSEIFPDERSRPCLRTFKRWQRARLFPWRKIGRRVFVDPSEVRRSIDRLFNVQAID